MRHTDARSHAHANQNQHTLAKLHRIWYIGVGNYVSFVRIKMCSKKIEHFILTVHVDLDGCF